VILFCDTSALLKLFVDEEGIAVCRITWAESMAAIAQRSRIKGANQSMLAKAKSAFEQAWQSFAIADVTQPLVEKAGLYAEAFALRGYDSVQRAAAGGVGMISWSARTWCANTPASIRQNYGLFQPRYCRMQ